MSQIFILTHHKVNCQNTYSISRCYQLNLLDLQSTNQRFTAELPLTLWQHSKLQKTLQLSPVAPEKVLVCEAYIYPYDRYFIPEAEFYP